MEITATFKINVSAKAVYRNNEINISVTGSMPLANNQERSVQAAVDSGFSEKTQELFQKAFDAAIKEKGEQVATLTRVANGEALSVAARMREL